MFAADDGATWTLAIDLKIDGERTRRELEGSSCPALTSAAAFIIATAIDPRVATIPPPIAEPPPDPEPPLPSGAESEPAADAGGPSMPPPQDPGRLPPTPTEDEDEDEDGPKTPRPRPATDTPPPPTRPRDEPPKRRPRLGLGAQAGVGFGPTPRVGAVLGLAVAAVGPRWRVELGGEYWTPSTANSAANADVGVMVQAWDVVVRGCGVPRVGRVSLPLCGGLGAGALRGRGTGDLAVRRATSAGWIRALLGPGVLVEVAPRVAVGLRVDGFLTLANGAFRTEPSGRAYEPRLGGISGVAHLEFRLP